jgi:hypothetical protein
MRRRVTPFAVHREKTLFAVRQGQKRTAKKALCRAPRPQTHGKGTVSAVGFGHFAVRLPENARQSGHCSFFSHLKIPKNHRHNMHFIIFITCIVYIIIFITSIIFITITITKHHISQ